MSETIDGYGRKSTEAEIRAALARGNAPSWEQPRPEWWPHASPPATREEREEWRRLAHEDAAASFPPLTSEDFAKLDRMMAAWPRVAVQGARARENTPSAAQAPAESAPSEGSDSPPVPDPRALRAAGFDPIPLRPSDKRPRDKRWLVTDYSDADLDRAVAAGANVGLRLTASQIALDYDPRNAAPDTLARLGELVPTLGEAPCCATCGGGFHWFYALPEGTDPKALRGSLDIPGVDVKKWGGYVVAAGSRHPSGTYYRWESEPNGPLPMAPDSLLAAIRKPETASSAAPAVVSVEQVERCLELLDPRDFREHDRWLALMMACHSGNPAARDAFIAWSTSDPQYAGDGEIVEERWDSLRPDGGVTIGTLYHEVQRAGHPKPRDAAADFEDIAEDELPSSPYMTAAAYAESVKPAPPVIDGMLYGAGVTILYGEEGRGKSYVALDLAFHVASGRASWHGRQLYLHGRAVYIAGEGQHSIPERLRAWATHHGVALDSLGRRFMLRRPGGVNLTAAQVREQMRAELAELRPSLVVVDTLSSVLAGTDENAVKDVSPFLGWCADVARDAGACVLVLHHPAKGSGLARGSSAITANTDGSIKLEGESGKPFRLSVRKVRSGAPMKGLRLELRSVSLGPDPERPGREIMNAVVVQAPETGPTTAADLAWELGEAEGWPVPRARLVEALGERWGLKRRPIEDRIKAEIPNDPDEARDRLSPVYLARVKRADGRPGHQWEIRPTPEADGE